MQGVTDLIRDDSVHYRHIPGWKQKEVGIYAFAGRSDLRPKTQHVARTQAAPTEWVEIPIYDVHWGEGIAQPDTMAEYWNWAGAYFPFDALAMAVQLVGRLASESGSQEAAARLIQHVNLEAQARRAQNVCEGREISPAIDEQLNSILINGGGIPEFYGALPAYVWKDGFRIYRSKMGKSQLSFGN